MNSVRLHFRAVVYNGISQFLRSEPAYYQVVDYPMQEMTGSTPASWAGDFLDITASTPWCAQHRRSMLPGDIITYQKQFYMLVPADERINLPTTPIPNWPAVVLVHLPQNYADQLNQIFAYLNDNSGDTVP